MTPLRTCREAAGLELTDIRKSGLSFARLVEIDEGSGRPVTREEAKKLGKLFDCPAINFLPMSFAGCCDLPDEAIEDEILRREQ